MWPGVFVWAHTWMCLCVCVGVCVHSFVSSQLNLANLPWLSAASFLSPSLPSSSPSPSPMNRLNFLMSCFYGLLMLIHSSPYALPLHPSVSPCLPWLIHPFFSPHQPHSYHPQPWCHNDVPTYQHWSTHTHTHIHAHSHRQSPEQCSHVCRHNLATVHEHMPNLPAHVTTDREVLLGSVWLRKVEEVVHEWKGYFDDDLEWDTESQIVLKCEWGHGDALHMEEQNEWMSF